MATTLLCRILPTLIILLLFYGVHDAVASAAVIRKPGVRGPGVKGPGVKGPGVRGPAVGEAAVIGEDHMIIPTPAAVSAQAEALPVQPTATSTGRILSLEASSLMPSPTLAPSKTEQLRVQDLVGGVPSGLRPFLKDKPEASPGCLTTKCRIFYPSIDLYYWSESGANTACLSTIVDEPATGGPTEPLDMVSPSIYVVFPPFTAYDMCGNCIYSDGPTNTKTYNPLALSTLQAMSSTAPVIRAYNFSDLPCPPPEIAQQLDPGAAYKPLVTLSTSWGVPWGNANETWNCDLEALHGQAIMDPFKAHKVVRGRIDPPVVGPQHPGGPS